MASIWDYILAGGGGAAEGGRAAETLGLQRSAQDLERSKLRADLFMQGFDPAAASGPSPAQPSQPSAPTAPVAPSGPAPVAPMAPVAPPGPPAMPAIPAPQGPGPSVPQVRIRGGMAPATPAVDAMRAAAGTSQTPAPAPSSPGGFDLGAFMRTNGQAVDLPGIGRFQYNFDRSPMARQYMLNKLEREGAADAAIRESQQTGQTAKNLREANTLKLGDPGFAAARAQEEGAIAAAKLPIDLESKVREGQITLANAKTLEGVRASVQMALQKNQQDFELGRITIQHKNALDEQTQRMAGDFYNSLGVKDYEMTGHPMEMGSRHLFGGPRPTAAPSDQLRSGASVTAKYGITPTVQY